MTVDSKLALYTSLLDTEFPDLDFVRDLQKKISADLDAVVVDRHAYQLLMYRTTIMIINLERHEFGWSTEVDSLYKLLEFDFELHRQLNVIERMIQWPKSDMRAARICIATVNFEKMWDGEFAAAYLKDLKTRID